MYITIGLIIIIILFLLSAWCSSVEAALMTLSRIRIKKLVVELPKKAKGLKLWLTDPNHVITTILISNNIVNISASVIATSLAIEFAEFHGLNRALAVSISAAVVTLILIVFSEASAKIFGIHNSERMVLFSINSLYYVTNSLKPIVYIFAKLGGIIAGSNSGKKVPVITHEDVRSTIAIGHEEGVLGLETKQMMHSVLNFSQLTAREIMTSREKIEMVNIDFDREKFIDLVVETGHSRVPVYKVNPDNIIGIIYERDLLNMLRSDTLFNAYDLLRPVAFVDENKKISELMREFKKGESHMAVVRNAKGRVVGLITIEDIVEEVFGEIMDEYDIEDLFKG